ncbi:hypothetical protein PIB30_109301, partial [Stylosanthes scabra]|nr:hypothetical protein [Stylosanthes scabra]
STQKVDGKDVEKKVPKTKKEYNEDDWKKIAFNFKAINFLHYGLNQNDYLKISTCKTAKEIWDKLVIIFEEVSDEGANICLIAKDNE